MKKTILNFLIVMLCAGSLSAQSMYGDEVKADVKMNYVYSLEEALTLAKEKNKPIFFNCFADWAVPCHAMNKKVFSDQEFADWMDERFINFFTDVTKGNGKVLAKKYDIKTQAHYLVLNADGEVVHRIIGGSTVPEFKKQLEKALSPKTSLKGMTATYEAGERKLKFMREYFSVLRKAEEDKQAKVVLDEIFAKLSKKQWSKKENWFVFTSKMRGTDDEYFKYLLDNKAAFVKQNGAEAVEKSLSNIFNRVMFKYAAGSIEYDAAKLLDLYLLMQKAGLAKEDVAYSLYSFAKYRGEHNIAGLVEILNEQKDVWEPNLLRTIDLSVQSMKDFSKEDKQILTSYWQQRADFFKGVSTANHYRDAIKGLNTTTGIKFADLTFQEALDKAAAEDKLVFMDCFTTWCAPCKWLDHNTFSDEVVGKYFNEKFVNVKMDMEKGEGVELREKYEVVAFPTMLVLDAKGNVVKKIVGAVDSNKMMQQIQAE